jgi:hypothetical protein
MCVPKKCFIILVLVITRILKISLEAKLLDKNYSYHFSTSFNQEFLITFGQLYFKRFSAIRSKRLTHLHYAHSHVTSQGPNRVLIPAGRERKQI